MTVLQRVSDGMLFVCWLSLGLTIELAGYLLGIYTYVHWSLAIIVALALFGTAAPIIQRALRGRPVVFAASIFAAAVAIEWTNARWLHLWAFHSRLREAFPDDLTLALAVASPLLPLAWLMAESFGRPLNRALFAVDLGWSSGSVRFGRKALVFTAIVVALVIALGRYGNAEYILRPFGIGYLALTAPLEPRPESAAGELGANAAILVFAFQVALILIAVLVSNRLCAVDRRGLGLGLGSFPLRDGLPLLVFLSLAPLPGFIVAGLNPAMATNYPFVRGFDSIGAFVAYEFGYLLFFLAVELLFRSVLFLGYGAVCSPNTTSGFEQSGQAAVFATILSSLCYVFWHLGKPVPELSGAVVWGPVACAIIWRTRSILYLVIPHWVWNSTLDAFVMARRLDLFAS